MWRRRWIFREPEQLAFDFRSYRTQEGLVDRLDAWFGPDSSLWVFLSERLIPFMGKMSVAMAALMFTAALLHGDLVFAGILLAIAILAVRLRRPAVPQ